MAVEAPYYPAYNNGRVQVDNLCLCGGAWVTARTNILQRGLRPYAVVFRVWRQRQPAICSAPLRQSSSALTAAIASRSSDFLLVSARR